MLQIIPVSTKKQKKEFFEFPNCLYKGNLNYVPYPIEDDISSFSQKKNPAFSFCSTQLYIAVKGGRTVGRIGGIINKAANEKWSQSRVRITHFDFIDDYEVSQALIDAVVKWGRENELKEICGPMGFTDLDREGMLIEGFNEPGTFITYYNASYYAAHMEKMNFRKDAEWTESRIKINYKNKDTVEKMIKKIVQREDIVPYFPKSMREKFELVGEMIKLINSEYSELYGTTYLTPELAKYYQKQYMTLIPKKYLCMVKNKDNEFIGFGVALPGIERSLKKFGGHLFPLGVIFVVYDLLFSKTMDMGLIAVKKQYRNKGIPLLIVYSIIKNLKEGNIKYAETGPMLTTNTKVRSLWRVLDTKSDIRKRVSWVRSIDA